MARFRLEGLVVWALIVASILACTCNTLIHVLLFFQSFE